MAPAGVLEHWCGPRERVDNCYTTNIYSPIATIKVRQPTIYYTRA